MTLDKLDEELAAWQKAALTIVNNVYGLYEHPACKMLSAEDRKTAGVTQARATAAVAAVRDLLDLSLALDNVVKHASTLRSDLPLLFPNDRLREIEQLLTGPSVKLSDAETPLAQRGLLSNAATTRALTPRQLLDVMLPAFDTAKATILAIDDAWTNLPSVLDSLENEIKDLGTQAAACGFRSEPALSEIFHRIERARAALLEDPLGVAGEVEKDLQPGTAILRQRIGSLLEQRRNIASAVLAALGSLEELRALHGRALAAQAERSLKVEIAGASPSPQVPAPEKIAALTEWHAKLGAAVARDEWQPAQIGLEKWRGAVREMRAACEETLRLDNGALEARRELRGRLEALKAKAANCGCAEDASLGNFEREATALLLRRPTPMHETERLVGAYQRELASKTRASR